MEHMKDKVVIVTGANSGIGKETARRVAKAGSKLIMVSRSEERGAAAREELISDTGNEKIDLMLADISLMEDVRKLAENIKSKYPIIDVLINNAGFMGFPERRLTKEGIEATVATNHLGPFLLTRLLQENIAPSDHARVVFVSSVVHSMGKLDFEDLEMEKDYSAFKAYSNTKFMNVLSTEEFARRDDRIAFNSLHPGNVSTNIAHSYPKWFRILYEIGRPFLTSASSSGKTSFKLATDPKLEGVSGKYFSDGKLKPAKNKQLTPDNAKKLWEWSEQRAGLK
jgi:NAD(P)-dependent dehydrogenase (short-subunit alcohol dehydrogenase family)